MRAGRPLYGSTNAKLISALRVICEGGKNAGDPKGRCTNIAVGANQSLEPFAAEGTGWACADRSVTAPRHFPCRVVTLALLGWVLAAAKVPSRKSVQLPEASLIGYLVRSAFIIGAAALFAGCGGSQPPIGALGAMPQSSAIAEHATRGESWMLPEAKSEDLLYVVLVDQAGRKI